MVGQHSIELSCHGRPAYMLPVRSVIQLRFSHHMYK